MCKINDWAWNTENVFQFYWENLQESNGENIVNKVNVLMKNGLKLSLVKVASAEW